MADPEVERFFSQRESKGAKRLALENSPVKTLVVEATGQVDGETRLKYQEILGFLEKWAAQTNEKGGSDICSLDRHSDTNASFTFALETVRVELFHGPTAQPDKNSAIHIHTAPGPIEMILNAVGGTTKWVPTNLVPRNYVGDSRHVASQILSACQYSSS